ncbi:hypothetical protein [Dactylosporangium sp. CA-139066]|uniref:hypothetical protein n=1 Tax=Dactylosporangium sp. CA-139066 TaxID=3239930 RepID=UPI003D8C99C1
MSAITNTETLPVGLRVKAVDYRGIEVEGTITERSWFFEHLNFYVVREDANGRPYWDIPEHHIYPCRDQIRAAS